jgi:hypothetical protein
MAKGGPGVTVTLRKVSTGHRVCAFQLDDLNHAYSIAMVLVRSREYMRCYAVATDWQGDVLFNLQPEQVAQGPAPYVAPQPQPQHYALPQPQYPVQPQYPQPQYPPPHQSGFYPQQQFAPPALPQYQQPQQQPQVIDAEIVDDGFAPPPGYPRLAGGRR